MLWRRPVLEAGGGIEALGAEIAEDAAATKLIQKAGLSAHLVDAPFVQPLGPRRWREVWARQVRWARLRRATFPLHFAPELADIRPLRLDRRFLRRVGIRARSRDRRDRSRRWPGTARRPRSPGRPAGGSARAPSPPGWPATSLCPGCGRRPGRATISSGGAMRCRSPKTKAASPPGVENVLAIVQIVAGAGASQSPKSSYLRRVVNELKGGDPVSHCLSPRVICRAWVIVRAEKDRV